MKPLDELASQAREIGLHLRVNAEHLDRVARMGAVGLFHVPLLALCILIVSHGKKGELSTSDLASWTGATLGHYFSGIEAARRRLEWSLAHRRRCADALVFLENLSLIDINQGQARTLKCSQTGNEFLRKLFDQGDETGVLCRGLERSYRAVEHHGLSLL
jgi:hypothetical protein